MSVEAVRTVVARALTELEYRELLFTDAEKALEGYALADEERSAVKTIQPESLYAIVGRLGAHQLLPMRYGRRLVVVPPSLAPSSNPDDTTIVLDHRKTHASVTETGRPVTDTGQPVSPDAPDAFGSGVHATTRLCLGALEDYVQPGQTVIDLGTGSGILAIAAAKLGAAPVMALDTDPAAVQVARDHVSLNGLRQIARVEQGSLERILPDRPERAAPTAHLIVGNLLTQTIIGLLQQGLASALEPNGLLILSGIREDEIPEMVRSLQAAGLIVVDRRRAEDWAAVVARRTTS